MEDNLYKNYSSIAVFEGTTEKDFTAWSRLYFKNVIRPHLPKNKDINILEVGCGYGRYLLSLHELGYLNVKGVDISEEQIEYGKNVLNLKQIYLDDAINFLNKSNESFDVVLAIDVFEHLTLNYAISLTKLIYSRLNTNGIVIIQVPNGISLFNPIYYSDITHVTSYSAKSMKQLLMLGNFNTIQSYEIPPIPNGIKSYIRFFIWKTIVKPIIKAYMLVVNGELMGGIYTSNILTKAIKNH